MRGMGDEHGGRPLGDVAPGHQVRHFHGQPHAPDLPSPGAIAPVLLGEEHSPTLHRAGHPTQLVDPTQRPPRRWRPHQTQDLTVWGRYLVDVCCWPPHATKDASIDPCRPGWRLFCLSRGSESTRAERSARPAPGATLRGLVDELRLRRMKHDRPRAAFRAYEFALPYGLTLAVKSLTTAGMAAAQAAPRRAGEAIERQARERTEAGLALDACPTSRAKGNATASTRRS